MIYLLALVLGAIYVLGFAPFDFWPAAMLAIAGLYVLLQQDGIRPGWLAWCFGLGKYGLGVSWVYVSINVYGNAPPPLAGFLVVLFVALLALLFCVPLGILYTRLRPAGCGPVQNVLLFAGAWVCMDWVSSWLLTGFPWLLPGYAFIDTFMAPLAAVVGVVGLGFVCVLLAASLAAMLQRKSGGAPGPVQNRGKGYVRLSLLCGVLLISAYALSFADWVKPGERQTVALVQGNISQAVKWRPENAVPNVRKHLALSAEHWDADILLWPEAAVTLYPHQAQGLLKSLSDQGKATETDIILGIPGANRLSEGGYELQNLAIGLGEARGRFAKHHLVPFGEYVPLESLLRGMIEFFDLPMSSSVPGSARQPNLKLRLGEAAMAICYEIVYPESMRQRALHAEVLLTISNDSWFGTSIGPLQHMQIARMRAVENGRWLLRATNNGVTAIVNPAGRVVARLPQFEEGVLRGEIAAMQGHTPFSAVGHWPVLGLLLATFSWAGWRRRRTGGVMEKNRL